MPPLSSPNTKSTPSNPERASEDSALFSVVIPCYNQATYLPKAIESVQAQSYTPTEIIVVDDGSTDETDLVAKDYSSVTYQRQSNQGLGAARNAGLRAAQGEYILFLDADDWLLPNALSKARQAFEEAPEAALVAGGHVRYTEADGAFDLHTPQMNGDAYTTLLRRNVIEMHGAVAYRRAVLEDHGGFDETLPACEDYDLYLRLAREEAIHVHEGLMAVYRHHGENMSGNPRLMLSSILRVLERQPLETPSHEQAHAAGQKYYKNFYGTPLFRKIRDFLLPNGSLREATASTGMLLRTAPTLVLREMGKQLHRALPTPVRRAVCRAFGRSLLPGDVRMGDLRRRTPVSRSFGFDRGTPIDRHYIEGFLDAHRADVRGRVLEIAEDTYTQRFGDDRVTTSDVLHLYPYHPTATITGDLTDADHIPSDTFDCIILTQTLQLIYDVEAALATLHRILSPGGVLLATVPGITPTPQDVEGEAWYWSFTRDSLARLAKEKFAAARVQTESHGNVLAATSFLQGLAVEELTEEELDEHDPDYQVIVTLRAEKAPSSEANRPDTP